MFTNILRYKLEDIAIIYELIFKYFNTITYKTNINHERYPNTDNVYNTNITSAIYNWFLITMVNN